MGCGRWNGESGSSVGLKGAGLSAVCGMKQEDLNPKSKQREGMQIFIRITCEASSCRPTTPQNIRSQRYQPTNPILGFDLFQFGTFIDRIGFHLAPAQRPETIRLASSRASVIFVQRFLTSAVNVYHDIYDRSHSAVLPLLQYLLFCHCARD